MTGTELARRIDHTLLKPEATAGQIDRLCDEALQYGFFSVCVNPVWVERCVRRLVRDQTRRRSDEAPFGVAQGPTRERATCRDDAIRRPIVCTVAGFPLGATTSAAKAYEARTAVEQGALEVDMVVNLGALVAGDKAAVVRDIEAVVAAVKRPREDALVKVILETRALTDEQIVLGCRCVAEAQADFVKTSTGFHPAGGATVEHVALLRKHAAPIRVKAAGGIRDLPTALAMIEAGADRLGMSASAAVIEALAARA